jgi:hypothetical protein
MSRSSAIRDAWHPQTRQDRDAILLELQEVLASPHFCNSKRYPALLKYIVEETLAGNSEALKERTLGVEVFDRPPAYDTNADTVVRYTAGEVRKRLSLYYHELDRKPLIQISLPAGSYIPEFLHAQDEPHDSAGHTGASAAGLMTRPDLNLDPASPMQELVGAGLRISAGPVVFSRDGLQPEMVRPKRRWWVGIATIVVVAALAGFGWRSHVARPNKPLENFWAPVLRDQSAVLVCTGGSVFSQSHLSGVDTATKDIEYPFVSMQSASAIASISGLVERSGATTQLEAAATTPLPELRDRPVILLGGYNNQWTMRLLEPLPFHFGSGAEESIVETAPPHARWARDPSLPYSSADDYALLARFRDTTTDGWVVVLAGVGRNGTEAAANFATSPHYMQLLRDQLGSDISNRNIEAVLKVNVIDGKTGAPSILAARTW